MEKKRNDKKGQYIFIGSMTGELLKYRQDVKPQEGTESLQRGHGGRVTD